MTHRLSQVHSYIPYPSIMSIHTSPWTIHNPCRSNHELSSNHVNKFSLIIHPSLINVASRAMQPVLNYTLPTDLLAVVVIAGYCLIMLRSVGWLRISCNGINTCNRQGRFDTVPWSSIWRYLNALLISKMHSSLCSTCCASCANTPWMQRIHQHRTQQVQQWNKQ